MSPEFGSFINDWTRLDVAVRVAKAQLGPDGNQALLQALQDGLIRSDGIEIDTPDSWGYQDIHLFTADFVMWIVGEEKRRRNAS